uniref:G-protein coupled receptors family 1 profile domain-containing protein n=1 Tax=Neogobius melanostomus TaxID=47308 RepID=A0A8C6UE49_9GOBI
SDRGGPLLLSAPLLLLDLAVLFALALLWYALIVAGNVAILVLVVVERSLHAPMYVFLCSLCVNALYGSLGFFPKFLLDLLSSCPTISYSACLLQGYVIHSSTCGDFSILTLMAYDRYVAICRPLTYHTLMSRTRVCVLVLASWLVPLLAMFLNTATLVGRRLCGERIGRIYCVNWMVRALTCTPPQENTAVGYFNMFFYFGHFLFVLWSYLYLVRTCLRSREGTRRFMNTCVPHMLSLCTFCCSVLMDLLYMRFGSAHVSPHAANFFAIEFLLVPPLVNPLIYGLKLSRIRLRLLGPRRGQGGPGGKRGPGAERGPQGGPTPADSSRPHTADKLRQSCRGT